MSSFALNGYFWDDPSHSIDSLCLNSLPSCENVWLTFSKLDCILYLRGAQIRGSAVHVDLDDILTL